jgi:hypothetical protein
MNKTVSLAASLVLASAAATAPAHAAALEGVQFDDAVRLAGSELQLNGLGVRAVLVIKGYVAGLYLPHKAATTEAALGATGPKRLQIRMLRQASSKDFNDALVSGMRKNASEAELQQLGERIAQLERTIDGIGAARKGDSIEFDFVPERGTTLTFNGRPQGAPIPGNDFYRAVLQIFIGEHPVDARLKKGLLGQ